MAGLITSTSAETLLQRMRAGDRQAAAEFMERMGSRLRRRLGSKLGPEMRRVLDSADVLSTVVRRLDRFVLSRQLRAASMGELWSFLCVVADRAVSEKGRRIQSDRAEAPGWTAHVRDQHRAREREARGTPGIDLRAALDALPDSVDREILVLWFSGRKLRHISAAVGIAPTGVRKRWQSIRERLRHALREEHTP